MNIQQNSVSENNFEQCIKCTICTVYCPVAAANPDYPGPKQAGPDGERLRLKQPDFYDNALKYCMNCKRCEVACPSNVRIGDIIQAARIKYGPQRNTSLRNFVLSNTDLVGSLATPFAPIVNSAVALKPVRYVMDKVMAIDHRRVFPKYAHGTFTSWYRKHAAAAQAAYPDASAPVQAYVAANLELEAALSYLVEQLEARGIADDTVICLSADHYPYALAETDVDYYAELTGRQDTDLDTSRYRNALILWCGSMTEPVTVDVPCSAVDIVPTLSNLFGLSYDSRLLSGRDILDDSYNAASASGSFPLVILPTSAGNSWATAAGVYEAPTGTFTPNPGITVEDGYVDSINRLVSTKYTYAKLLIQYDYYRVVLGGNG